MKLLVVVLIAVGCASAAVVRIGLQKQQNDLSQLRLQNKRLGLRALRTVKESVPLMNQMGVMYYANITVGTPPQVLRVGIDTACGNFWVYDSSCTDCQLNHDPDHQHVLFDSSKSSTFVDLGKKFDTTMTSYNSKGFLAKESMTFGTHGEVAVKNQIVGLTQNHVQISSADGILGLAFPSKSDSIFVPPFYTAMSQGAVDKGIFTLYMKRGEFMSNMAIDGGMITYGGLDTQNCGDVIGYVPLSTAIEWRVPIKSVAFGSYSSDLGQEAVLSSLFQGIMMPQNVFEKICSVLGVDPHVSLSFPCTSETPNLKLTLGGTTIELASENYVTKNEWDNSCWPMMFGVSYGGSSPVWEIGHPLFWQYCTVFDMSTQRLGFAPPKN